MSLTIQPSAFALPEPTPAKPPGPGVSAGAPGNSAPPAGAADRVAFSPVGVLLAQLQADARDAGSAAPSQRVVPDGDQLRLLTGALAQRLGVLLRDARLPTWPAVAFDVVDDAVRVLPHRPDSAQLQQLVDAHDDVQALVRVLHAHAGVPAGAASIPPSLARQFRNDADIEQASGDVAPQARMRGWWPLSGDAPQRDDAPRSAAWLGGLVVLVVLLLLQFL